MVKCEDNILVDLPSGELSKNKIRKNLERQKGGACVLYAMRRIAFFDGDSNSYFAYKYIKNSLCTFSPKNPNFNKLFLQMRDACYMLGIEPEKVFNGPEVYQWMSSIPNIAWVMLYAELLHVILPKFNVQASDWKPSNDVNILKNLMKIHGAMMFSGKFGKIYYDQKPIRQKRFDTDSREVYSFKKGAFSYRDDYNHAIIVDQVKRIAGIDVVYFRDPLDSSKLHRKEKVYMLRYSTFIKNMSTIYSRSQQEIFACYGNSKVWNNAV